MPSYSRATLQRLAQAKYDDALLLFQHGRCSNAYYLGGYSVELGLKAALSIQFARDTLPDKKFVVEAYTHKLPELVKLAGLQATLRTALDANAIFAANWGVVSAWDESSRYESTDPFKVTHFLSALSDVDAGVFTWVKRHW